MTPDLERVMQLQRIDVRIAELQKEIAALPKYIAAIEATLSSHIKKLDADHALLASNQKERKQQDLDIQTHQQKISKLRDQMLSAKTNEQYRAFQHEIEYCEQAIRKCEDRVLELMESSEPLDANVKAAEGALQREKAEVEKSKGVARQRTAADEAALAQLAQERAGIQAAMNPSLYATYDKIRRKMPVAVADASTGRCSACQMELRPQFIQDLRKGEQVMLCENCRRILVFNAPVAVDVTMNAAAPARQGTRVDMT